MLYLVADNCFNKDTTRIYEDDVCFVVNANNDQELVNAITAVIENKCYEDDYYSNMTLDDYDGTVWQVRELGENFKIELSISRKISGKRY